MTTLRKRLRALEHGTPDTLPPAVKAWLGHNLTPAEQLAINDDAGTDLDLTDMAGLSQEARAWLSQR